MKRKAVSRERRTDVTIFGMSKGWRNLIAGIVVGTVVFFIMYGAHLTGAHH